MQSRSSQSMPEVSKWLKIGKKGWASANGRFRVTVAKWKYLVGLTDTKAAAHGCDKSHPSAALLGFSDCVFTLCKSLRSGAL
jgi:hypothetical protein